MNALAYLVCFNDCRMRPSSNYSDHATDVPLCLPPIDSGGIMFSGGPSALRPLIPGYVGFPSIIIFPSVYPQ